MAEGWVTFHLGINEALIGDREEASILTASFEPGQYAFSLPTFEAKVVLVMTSDESTHCTITDGPDQHFQRLSQPTER